MKFLVSDTDVFVDRVISELRKLGVSAERDESQRTNIAGGTPKIRFRIYPHFDFIPNSVVRLKVEGERLEFADYEMVKIVLTEILGVQPTLDFESDKKVSYFWKGTNY